MNILDFLTDFIQLRPQHTGARFIEYRIFNKSNVVWPFPHYIDFKLMSSLISVYICSFGDFFSLIMACVFPKSKDYIS